MGHSAVEEPHGRSFAVVDGGPYEPGGARDALRPSPRILPSDLAVLVVTDRRTLLRGARRTAAVPHAQLATVTVHRDGVRLTERGGATHILLVEDPDLTAAIVLQAARAAGTRTAARSRSA